VANDHRAVVVEAAGRADEGNDLGSFFLQLRT
jgi:hypothetical protein